MNTARTSPTQKRYKVEIGYTVRTVRGPQAQTANVRIWAEDPKDARRQVLAYYARSRPEVGEITEMVEAAHRCSLCSSRPSQA